MGNLREDQYAFITTSRLILVRMKKNVSDESCRESQKTHFMFNKIFTEILSFIR